jgi:hypothetical protein
LACRSGPPGTFLFGFGIGLSCFSLSHLLLGFFGLLLALAGMDL